MRIKSCIGLSNQQSIFQTYLKDELKNKKRYSYPRTENFDIRSSYQALDLFVEKNIEVANSYNSKDKEVFVEFVNGKGKIEIN